MRALALVVVVVAAGCFGGPSSPLVPPPIESSRPRASWWTRGTVACPAGTALVEGRTPYGRTLSCETPARQKRGPFASFYADGALMEEGTFANDRKHGRFTEWYASGTRRAEGDYVDGERHGAWTLWWETGAIKSRGAYDRGARTGAWEEFTMTGEPRMDWQVRPPVAADLAKYVGDLPGTGPLRAAFETSLGTIECELFDAAAPATVANFVGLARGLKPFFDPKTREPERRRFYDGLEFHRVVPGFVIQSGDPTGTGRGDPGYKFGDEIAPGLRHDKPGVLAMANAGPNSNGSQFYISEAALPHLDGKFTIFGQCANLDVVTAIAATHTQAERVKLIRVTIARGR